MSKKKIDRAYVKDVSGLTIEIFKIGDLKKAEDKATWMTEYHKEPFKVVIINEYVAPQGDGIQCKPSEIETIIKNKG